MPAAGSTREFLLPPGHDRFAQCHASTLVRLADGGRLVAFFAGTREGESDTAIWLARREAGGWAEPTRALAEPGTAHWNPMPLVPGDASPRGPVKDKQIVASNGEWLAPGWIETAATRDAFVDVSADRGRHGSPAYTIGLPEARRPTPRRRCRRSPRRRCAGGRGVAARRQLTSVPT